MDSEGLLILTNEGAFCHRVISPKKHVPKLYRAATDAPLDAADAASREPVSISATCTVFAESEVISRLAAGARREDVLRGVHDSIAQRAASLAARLQRESPILLTGGLARDAGLVRALERALDAPVETAPLSVYAGAIGAARIAARLARQREADA